MSKIFLRQDQFLSYILNPTYQDNTVTIFAPDWVSEGLEKLSYFIPIGSLFEIYDKTGEHESFMIDRKLDLKLLEMISRNEPLNTSGKINFKNYSSLKLNKSVIFAIKDLVRQCVIIAKDKTLNYGGFPKGRKVIKQNCDVIVVDLIALEFKNIWNTGRLVLISKNLPSGLLDDLIFENVVGEKKKLYSEVLNDISGRYVKHNEIFFDSVAYKKFVANDVLLTGLALNKFSKNKINFKFLKYGCGYFAGQFKYTLENLIGNGVALGLFLLFNSEQKRIKSVELPFYEYNKHIDYICKTFNIECKFGMDDALKQTHCDYITATTNCSNPHTVTGNTLGFSVDGIIARNIKSKANSFSYLINRKISEKFLLYTT